MVRRSEGTTKDLGSRITPEEMTMLRDIMGQLKLKSLNKAVRYAIRFTWQHATSTNTHERCARNSPCAIATRDIEPGRQHTAHAARTVNHMATVENENDQAHIGRA